MPNLLFVSRFLVLKSNELIGKWRNNVLACTALHLPIV